MAEEKKASEKKSIGVNGDMSIWDRLMKRTVIIGLASIVIVLSFIVFFLWRKKTYMDTRGEDYYAVFLSNGQVYFGHLFYENTSTPLLTDIYYLQASATGSEDGKAQYTLIKLGKELHGPDDEMYLNKDHILFWEKLSDDSKVVSSIESYNDGSGDLTVPQEQAEPYVEDEEPSQEESEDEEENEESTENGESTDESQTDETDTSDGLISE